MSAISDELRKLAEDYDVLPCYGLADRIDAEMIELPKDKDGRPINLGDEVRRGNGEDGHVTRIDYLIDKECEITYWSGRKCVVRMATELTNKRFDSLVRVADEIDRAQAWCDVDGKSPAPISSISNNTLHDWAERIRKLAKKEAGDDAD